MTAMKQGNNRFPLMILVVFFGFCAAVFWGNPGYSQSGGQAVEAKELFEFTAPKEETKDIRPKEIKPSAIPKRIPLRVLNIKDPNTIAPAKGQLAYITYALPQPALVRIRVLRQQTRELFLSTILNFEFRDAGTHTEVWDGRDYWGKTIDYSKKPYRYIFEAESVVDSPAQDNFKGVEYMEGLSQKQVAEGSDFDPKMGHIHARHKPEYENIPLLTISAPGPDETLKGIVAVRSFVDKARRGYGDKYGYGIRYYIDDQLIHEEFYKPESGGNFYYELDTTAYEDGEHLLYIGLCDHNAHTTSEGFKVVINNSSQ